DVLVSRQVQCWRFSKGWQSGWLGSVNKLRREGGINRFGNRRGGCGGRLQQRNRTTNHIHVVRKDPASSARTAWILNLNILIVVTVSRGFLPYQHCSDQ